MPRSRPPTSGYARIAQVEEEQEYSDDFEDDDHGDQNISRISNPQYAPIQPERRSRMNDRMSETVEPSLPDKRRKRPHNRQRSSSGVDIKAINARLEKWAEEIAQKFKIRKVKGKTQEEEMLEIHHSVFQAPEHIRPASAEMLASAFSNNHMPNSEFDSVVEKVRVAIELGIHPKMISQGSSGSYFARDSDHKVVGIFKPKDEEPYASRNPKWTKWIHRNLFPFFFGRACLIPNLSYISEAAAYVLDRRLLTNIVPYTDIVYFSSIAFNHDFWDRRAYYRKRKPLPQKLGSFQAFLEGFQDATIFLKQHPWPDQAIPGLSSRSSPRGRPRRWAEECRPGLRDISSDEEEEPSMSRDDVPRTQSRHYFWTEGMQQSFREQLEKLVILDYIMRNTDRGLDNWMIKVDEATEEVAIVAEVSKEDAEADKELFNSNATGNSRSEPYKREDPMTTNSGASTPSSSQIKQSIVVGAIDNSLSWPWKHPDAWRSYPFGWLFLPVSLIGQPFSEKTRLHFLPLLTSKQWWSDTQIALRRCFEQDSDFQERMFARQIAVMKGQAWNVVETLKTADHGPLELTRRARVCVWDDLVEIPTVVQMRVPSAEMRRRQQDLPSENLEEEEMDISSAHASSPDAQRPIFHVTSPSTELPNSNRFDLTRQSSSDIARNATTGENPLLTSGTLGSLELPKRTRGGDKSNSQRRPTARRSKTRASYDGPRPSSMAIDSMGRKRNVSFSTRRVQSNSFYEYGDDLEGDLGYAAAEVMEGNRRKVIVERLENVKGKNPVFTWC